MTSYTGWAKKRLATKLLSISSLNIDRFSDFHNSFTDTFSRKFAIKLLIEIPPHLKCVATLPCEMLKAEKLVII